MEGVAEHLLFECFVWILNTYEMSAGFFQPEMMMAKKQEALGKTTKPGRGLFSGWKMTGRLKMKDTALSLFQTKRQVPPGCCPRY
jgi:hypothetical protein